MEPSSFDLRIVDEPGVSPALDRAIRQLLCDCFPADVPIFSRSRPWNGCVPEYSVLHAPAEQVLGHVGVVFRTVTCGGSPVRIAGIQSLAVAPALRRQGLSEALMARAMEEAKRRGVPFGLLFCVPELEAFYGRQGWEKLDRPMAMRDAEGRLVPIPAKNIGMVLRLTERPYPAGELDLQGRDW